MHDELIVAPSPTTPNSRPILFSRPMVRAILAGTKTQTRRVVKLNAAGRIARGGRQWHPEDRAAICACPYGCRGDLLWVRETFAHDGVETLYAADCTDVELAEARRLRREVRDLAARYPEGMFRPSIHMPRRLSRIDLRITGVRVEYLWEISFADAIAEGLSLRREDQRGYFPDTWDAINGFGAWAANPLVWVVSFERVEQPRAAA